MPKDQVYKPIFIPASLIDEDIFYMSNKTFYICPECGSEDDIQARGLAWLDVYQDRDGLIFEVADSQISKPLVTGEHDMWCRKCDHHGPAIEFKTIKE